jgi:2-phosphosulfolactate phosphatase
MARALDEEVLLSGERGASRMAGFSLGNSPAEYSRDRVEGKLVVMTTSNGTRALQAVREALAVIVCSFLTVSAAARWLDRAGLDVVIVCAGRRGRFCLEDAVGSGMLIERVCHLGRDGVELTDAAEAARLLYLAHRQDLAALLGRSEWGRRLRTAGFSADLEVCARVDVTDIVPTLRNGRLVAERV